MLYPAMYRRQNAPEMLNSHVDHLEGMYHIIDHINGVRTRKDKFELDVKGLGAKSNIGHECPSNW